MEQFDNRLTLQNLRLVERYVNQEMHFLVHLRMGDGEEFIAYVQRDGFSEGLECIPEMNIGSCRMAIPMQLFKGRTLAWTHCVSNGRRACSEQKTVLVNLIKFMEFPEQVLPAFVWLEHLDILQRLWPSTFYFSTNLSKLTVFGTVEDREISVGRDGATVNRDKMASEMIECAPEVLQNVSRNEGDISRNVGEFNDVIPAFSLLMIVLKPDAIFTVSGASVQQRFQILDVLFGPLDFCG